MSDSSPIQQDYAAFIRNDIGYQQDVRTAHKESLQTQQEKFDRSQDAYRVQLASVGHELIKQSEPPFNGYNTYSYMKQQQVPILNEAENQFAIMLKAHGEYQNYKNQYDTNDRKNKAVMAAITSIVATGIITVKYFMGDSDQSENEALKLGTIFFVQTLLAATAGYVTYKLLPPSEGWTDERRAEAANLKTRYEEHVELENELNTRRNNAHDAIYALYENKPDELKNMGIAAEAENIIIHLTSRLNNPAAPALQ